MNKVEYETQRKHAVATMLKRDPRAFEQRIVLVPETPEKAEATEQSEETQRETDSQSSKVVSVLCGEFFSIESFSIDSAACKC
jgi:hypothetical protein